MRTPIHSLYLRHVKGVLLTLALSCAVAGAVAGVGAGQGARADQSAGQGVLVAAEAGSADTGVRTSTPADDSASLSIESSPTSSLTRAMIQAQCYVNSKRSPQMCKLPKMNSSQTPLDLVCTLNCTSWDEWQDICSCFNEEILKVSLNKSKLIKLIKSSSIIKQSIAPRLHCRDDVSISVTWAENLSHFAADVKNNNEIFLLETQQRGGDWIPYNLTRRYVSIVKNLMPSTDYRFRVRRFSLNGQKSWLSPDGDWIRTFPALGEEPLPDSGNLQPIQKVYQSEPFTFSNRTASTQIRWEPGENRTCWYNVIYIHVHESLGSAPLFRHLHVGEEPMEVSLSNLTLGEEYKVMVKSLERDWTHAAKGEVSAFCNIHPLNLTLNAPQAPTLRVNHTIIGKYSSSASPYILLDVTVNWEPIRGGPPSNFTVLIHSDHGYFKNTTVSGNSTWLTLRNVSVRRQYFVDVFATSPGGEGKHNKIRRDLLGIDNISFGAAAPVISGPFSETSPATVTAVLLVVIAASVAVTLLWRYLRSALRGKPKWRRKHLTGLENSTATFSSTPNGATVTPPSVDEWEIGRERLKIEDEIGRGAFGTVYRAQLSGPLGTKKVAVKLLRPDPSADDARQFKLEMEIMKCVDKHPNVLALLGCVTKPVPNFPPEQLLIVEYCALGDLQGFLRRAYRRIDHAARFGARYSAVKAGSVEYAQLMSHYVSTSESPSSDSYSDSGSEVESQEPGRNTHSAPLAVSNQLYDLNLGCSDQRGHFQRQKVRSQPIVTAADLLSFARQVAVGMEFLSASKVVHRDLAARNVLVCADRTVKISDFGLSRDIYEQNIYRKAGSEKIPVKWMAVESLSHQIYTTQSDVWSFGVLLWEIATLGGSPYPTVQNDELFRLLQSGYRMEKPATCGDELYSLMRECWHAEPSARPSFRELRKRLDNLLEAATPHHYLQIDQLFSAEPDASFKSNVPGFGAVVVDF